MGISVWREVRSRLSWLERFVPLRLLLLRGAVRFLRDATVLREQIRFEGMRVSREHRRALREIGRRLAERRILAHDGDLTFLRAEEIEKVLEGSEEGAGYQALVNRRREEMDRQREIPMPNLLRESEIPHLEARREEAPRSGCLFQGLPVGPGRVEGKVVVLEGPLELGRVAKGDILVTATLDPSWIPLFTLASGLVVEMGGALSHGSIIAREYGLPAVVNIPGITRLLQTGDRVRVDGSRGQVERLDGEADDPSHSS